MTDTATTDTAADEFHEERWVYLGEFTGQKIKRVASFRDPRGQTFSFKMSAALGRLSVGYVYTIATSDERIRGSFGWTGDKAEDADELRMQARVRENAREDALMQDKARRGDADLDELLAHVARYAARYTKTSSREALISLLTRAVWRASRRP